ncbi:hypothetical protein [Bacillus cereus]
MNLTYTGIITKVNKKTTTKGFKSAKVGDEVKLVWNLKGHCRKVPEVDCYLNGEYVDRKIADIVRKLFNSNWDEPNFTLEEVTK